MNNVNKTLYIPLYGKSYVESEYFHLELMIVPLDEGARMMATYYFRPYVAEEAAE